MIEGENELSLDSLSEEVGEEVVETPVSEDVKTPPIPAPKTGEKTVPYNRFKEVNDELQALKNNPQPKEQCLSVYVHVEKINNSFIVVRDVGGSHLKNVSINVFLDDKKLSQSEYSLEYLIPNTSFGEELTRAKLTIKDYTTGEVTVVLRKPDGTCPPVMAL